MTGVPGTDPLRPDLGRSREVPFLPRKTGPRDPVVFPSSRDLCRRMWPLSLCPPVSSGVRWTERDRGARRVLLGHVLLSPERVGVRDPPEDDVRSGPLLNRTGVDTVGILP